MFLSTILLALIVGAIAGGGLPRLADLKLRWTIRLGEACGGVCVPATTQCTDPSTEETCGDDGQWGGRAQLRFWMHGHGLCGGL